MEEHHPQMPPAVAPGTEMGKTRAAVGIESGGRLGNAHARQSGLDDHLRRKLHARGAEIHAGERVAGEAAEPAVKVPHRRTKKQTADAAENRIADAAILPGHGAGPDAALKTISHDEIVAFAEFFDERPEGAKVVAVVGIAHDHVASAGGHCGAMNRRAVAAHGNVHDARAVPQGEFHGAIGRSVVADHDLAGNSAARQKSGGLANAAPQGLGFIETRHHD